MKVRYYLLGSIIGDISGSIYDFTISGQRIACRKI